MVQFSDNHAGGGYNLNDVKMMELHLNTNVPCYIIFFLSREPANQVLAFSFSQLSTKT
jgi:hypothetical protein